MQAELARCIATAQQVLLDFQRPLTLPPPNCLDAQASSLLTNIVTSGIPKIEDARVPGELNTKLHQLTQEHFRRSCMLLQETHSQRGINSIRITALQLKATYTTMYERKLVHAASVLARPRVAQKQPFANDVLLYAFEQSQTPTRRERERLASLTGMSLEQVRVWFQNRRSRSKKKAPELQSRPVLQLDDLLAKVVTSVKAVNATQPVATDNDFEADCDSGYGSGTDCPSFAPRCFAPLRRESISLAISTPTSRSYPAPYIPRLTISESQFEPPHWRRTPALIPAPATTVTIDELVRSMSLLSLRQRRVAPRTSASSSSSNAANTVSNVASVASSQKGKPKVVRRDPTSGRRVAGGRRSASSVPSADSSAPIPRIPSATPSPSPVSSDAADKRKRPGPPRRKPAGKALSRQTSDSSVSSTASSHSDSSRSTSWASDVSFDSVSSNSSFSSLDSTPAVSSGTSQANISQESCSNVNALFMPSPQPQHEHAVAVPVYDFSSMTYDLSAVVPSALGGIVSLDNQLLGTVTERSQLCSATAPLPLPASDPSSFDVGVANMDTLLDFSASTFPTLTFEELLSDGAGLYSALLQQSSPESLQTSQQRSAVVWRDLSLVAPSLA